VVVERVVDVVGLTEVVDRLVLVVVREFATQEVPPTCV
jgi:hypothetical protein